MDEFEMKRRIYGYIKEICHYSQMQVFATSYYQKNYFQMQIDDATSSLISLYMDIWRMPERRGENRRYRDQELQGQTTQQDEQMSIQPNPQEPIPSQPEPQLEPQVPISGQPAPLPEMRTFTIEELAQFNGKDGQPAYVAVNGTVYDVSALTRWAGGNHFGLVAGRDLSGPFLGCHQGITDRLKKAVIVGILEKGV